MEHTLQLRNCFLHDKSEYQPKPIDIYKQQKILNVLKTEIYPDPYSHITTKILEYPRLEIDKENNEAETNTSNIVNNNANNNESGKNKSKNRRIRSRKSLRYMTQPVTLLEIRETDEDSVSNSNNATVTVSNNNESNLDTSEFQLLQKTVINRNETNDSQLQDSQRANNIDETVNSNENTISKDMLLAKTFIDLHMNDWNNRRALRRPGRKNLDANKQQTNPLSENNSNT